MGAFPSAALSIRPPENPLDQYAKALSIKSMVGQQQLQQGELQKQGQEIQSGAMDLQMKQIGLKNMQITQSALTDPHLEDELNQWEQQKGETATPSPTGTAASSSPLGLQLHPLAQFLAEKKGLPLMGPGGALELSKNLTEDNQKVATLLKTQADTGTAQLKAYGDQVNNLTDRAAPIFEETDAAKQATALGQFKNEVMTNPSVYPAELAKRIQNVNNVGDLATLVNYGKMHQHMIEDAKNLADAQKSQIEAVQKGRAAAPPTFQQQSDAANTLATYLAVPPNMRAGFAQEMKNAPDWESLQKVQARADAANESFQRSADARQQAMGMKDVAVGQAMATQLIGEDKALGAALDQTRGIRGLLDMSKGGNESATNAAQVRFAEHEIVEGGVKRMNQLELESLTQKLGTYGRQFNAWASKGFEGQMPAATNAEMSKILDAEDANSTASHARNTAFIQNRFSQINRGGIGAAPQNAAGVPKALSMAQIQQAAKDHNVSVEEATRQAKAAGIEVRP